MSVADRRETPNQEHLDRFIEDIRERYRFEKLLDCSLKELHEEKWLLRNDFMSFKSSFPPSESVLEGALRQVALRDRTRAERSLTPGERRRLRRVRRELLFEMNRAISLKKEERAKRRDDRLEKAVQFAVATAVTVKKLIPWRS